MFHELSMDISGINRINIVNGDEYVLHQQNCYLWTSCLQHLMDRPPDFGKEDLLLLQYFKTLSDIFVY